MTPPPAEPTTGEKIVGYCTRCPNGPGRCGRCQEIVSAIDAALAEKDKLIESYKLSVRVQMKRAVTAEDLFIKCREKGDWPIL